MDYTKREVFPSSPLALVAAEVRFSDAPRLRQEATLDQIAIQLEDLFPVLELQPQAGVNLRLGVQAGPAQAQPMQQVQVALGGRVMKNMSSTSAVTLFANRMTFETTQYTDFSEFRANVVACCQALVSSGVTPALRRVGLRYIDEIRVPGFDVGDARRWMEWVDGRLVEAVLVGPHGAPAPKVQGTASYDLGDRRGLNFRYAALARGAVVVSPYLARRPFDEASPFFVLDMDGYQNFGGPNATMFSVDAVAGALDAVHGPAGETFQNAITDAAREMFRRSSQ